MRLVSAPSFATTDGPAPGRDVYPPGRIVDLRVERVLNATNEVELGWTAPGADLDAGGAAVRYEIRCYTDRSRLDDSTSAIVVPASMAPTPGPPGLWQRTPVAVPWPNQVFYYAVAAVDAAGNRGRVSNIVSVYIYEPPPPPTTAPAILAADVNDSHDPSNGTESDAVRRNPSASSHGLLTDNQLYAIAGGVAGFILLLMVLSVAAFASRRRSARYERRKGAPASSAAAAAAAAATKIQVEPLSKTSARHDDLHDGVKDSSFCGSAGGVSGSTSAGGDSVARDRPVYKIYVNNAYIQEEDGELRIVTPDGRVIQRGSPWFSTLPRGRSLNNLDGNSINDLTNMHWSLPRSKTSPHRHKVLTNGSIMTSQNGGGSQGLVGVVAGVLNGVGGVGSIGGVVGGVGGASVVGAGNDGTSISSKPSVSSDDTGIEVNDHHGVGEADSRDSADLEQVSGALGLTPMLLPPPGFGTLQPALQYGGAGGTGGAPGGGYMPMYGHSYLPGHGSCLVPPLPSSPGSQDARVVRIPAIPSADHYPTEDLAPSWMTQFNDPSYSQPSNRRPLVGTGYHSSSFRHSASTDAPAEAPGLGSGCEPMTPTPSTPGAQARKKRHISFV